MPGWMDGRTNGLTEGRTDNMVRYLMKEKQKQRIYKGWKDGSAIRALTAPLENLGSMPSTHMAAYNGLLTPVPEYLMPPFGPCRHCMHNGTQPRM